MFVTIEGIDGAGKTTVVERLRGEFPEAVFTREPTESWLGDAVRRSIGDDDGNPLTDFFLFAADHADHVERVIRPSLADGELVICDRYIDSRYAYQSVSLEGVVDEPLGWIRDVHETWTVVPDLTLLLDLPPETAVERIDADEKYEKVGYLEKVRANYRALADESDRFVTLDATRPPDDVARDCVEAVDDAEGGVR